MSRTRTITIDTDDCDTSDINYLSDMIDGIIDQRYGHLVERLDFTIFAIYTPAPDDTSEED